MPHYDNAEGGSHDTRFCYLGERRLRVLEAELPADVFVLGVDGHTALVLDLDTGTGSVLGLGGVTVRKDGRSTVFPAGSDVSIGELVAAAHGNVAVGTHPVVAGPTDVAAPGASPVSAPLREEVARLEAVVSASLNDGDAPSAVRAILALEETIQSWSHDTDQSDALATARSALRSAIVCLGEMAATGTGDPADMVRPFVDALLAERVRARTARDWAAADVIRDRLVAAGIELHDAPDGTTWELRPKTPAG